MKLTLRMFSIPAVLGVLLFNQIPAYSGSLQIGVGLKPDPIVLNGTSGGGKTSECGNIAKSPNQVIKITEPIPYMRFSVQSAGQPTLLINGPTGNFCVLADGTGRGPQMSGYWSPGDYAIYIGDRGGAQHPYTLSLSQAAQ